MKNEENLYLTFLTSVILVCFLIIVSSAALESSEQNASHKDSSTNNGFPYPRVQPRHVDIWGASQVIHAYQVMRRLFTLDGRIL